MFGGERNPREGLVCYLLSREHVVAERLGPSRLLGNVFEQACDPRYYVYWHEALHSTAREALPRHPRFLSEAAADGRLSPVGLGRASYVLFGAW